MLKILVVSQHYWPSLGGAEVMLRQLSACWSRAGHEVTILTCQWQPQWRVRERHHGCHILRLPVWETRFIGTLRYLVQLRWFLTDAQGQFDLVFVSMLKHAAFAVLGARRRGGWPVVLRAEGAGATGDVAWQDKTRFGWWIRRRCQKANAIIAPSPVIHTELLEAGYSPESIHYLPNAVSIPPIPWNANELSAYRRALKFSDVPTICYTGRLHAEKGVQDLLHAIVRIRQRLGPLQAVLVGDGPYRESLKQLSAQLSIADHVHFVGQVEDVEPFLRASNLYVLPSYVEGLSVSLLEALALGMPVVASDIEANRGLLPDDMLPRFTVRDADALAETAVEVLQTNSADRARLCREHVAQEFALEPLAERYIELFQNLRSKTWRDTHRASGRRFGPVRE